MKKFVLAALVLVAGAGQAAQEIENIRSAGLVQVKSVLTERVGEQGFPSTLVKAVVVFGNPCQVPDADELVQIVNYSKNYDALNISLGNESQRICPMVYNPQEVTINLGVFTRPNDGMFRKITVNQVAAR